ncbi:MAG: hypothetical protein GY832_15265 [Chloroflexi bacterium]|nr:hypothetical protein [Chloroflexota bacterium]
MKPITKKLDRFQNLNGWANRILRVDLSNMRITVQPVEPYAPNFLGARGIAAKICWDEYPEPVPPLDPANPLMIFAGALTGSRSPYSGRTNICAFSPQAYPYPWFTRSSVGARFGGELKRAGYDGIIVTGAAEEPVRICIRDDEVSVLPADDLWGQDALDTLDALASIEGESAQSLAIGPAGEHLSAIATIQAASSSASGQGGFGAVMGSKNLKAISVVGTGRVSLAAPKTITSISRTLSKRLVEAGRQGPVYFDRDIDKLNEQLAAEGNGKARCYGCTEVCLTPCAVYVEDMPGHVFDRKWSGNWHCVGMAFLGWSEDDPSFAKVLYDWQLARRAAFELNILSNTYGLNQFDILVGIVPWLIACQKDGLISEVNGRAIDWQSPEFWVEFLRVIAYREGLGDTLAQGGWAAAKTLRMGEKTAQERYAGWGQTGHWDGHDGWVYPFPFWLVSALQWLADTRDPFSTGHGSLWSGGASAAAASLEDPTAKAVLLDQIRTIGEHVYGSADAVDPRTGYHKDRARVAHYHTVRPVIKDCVPIDDWGFPLIFNRKGNDHQWRLDIEGLGEIEGPSVEYHLFAAGTGVDWSEKEFERAAERVCTLERAIQVRHWARDRQTDELVLPYFEQGEPYQNPFLEKCHTLDREQFEPIVDEFYALHGWDTENGWPTRERLHELEMEDVYQPMVDGAKSHSKPAD